MTSAATPRQATVLAPPPAVPVAWYWGDDGYGVERAAAELAERLAGPDGPPLERTGVAPATTTAARIGELVATAPLFGGGTLVVVRDPAPLLRSKADLAAIGDVIAAVAPGNGLAFLDLVDGTGRRPAALDATRDAVAAAGGEVRRFVAPTREGMTRWIEERAAERGIRLGRGAAVELATRVGGFVREGDIDRRRQGLLAVAELEKLGIYRSGGDVAVEDVRALVSEAVPGSTWAFLDAVAARQTRDALEIGERVFETTPEPVVVTHLHRRLRELIDVADRLAAGENPPAIARAMKLKPFRAQKLVEQARAWSPAELDAALEGLLDYDAAVKGSTSTGEAARRLAFTLWVAERVARRRPSESGRAVGTGRSAGPAAPSRVRAEGRAIRS